MSKSDVGSIQSLLHDVASLDQFKGLPGSFHCEDSSVIELGSFIKHHEMPCVNHSHGRRTVLHFPKHSVVLHHEDGRFLLGVMNGSAFEPQHRGRELTLNRVAVSLILSGQCKSTTPQPVIA